MADKAERAQPPNEGQWWFDRRDLLLKQGGVWRARVAITGTHDLNAEELAAIADALNGPLALAAELEAEKDIRARLQGELAAARFAKGDAIERAEIAEEERDDARLAFTSAQERAEAAEEACDEAWDTARLRAEESFQLEKRAEAAEKRNAELVERLGCALEELERRCPLDADPLTAAIIRDARAALAASGSEESA